MKTSECNGCGYCCTKVPCDASRRLYPGAEVCPALIWVEDVKMHRCSLMQIGGELGAIYRKELSAGAGCCSNLNSWRQDVKRRTRDDIFDGYFNPLDKKFQIFLKCWASEPFLGSDIISLILTKMDNALEESGYGPQEIEHTMKTISHMVVNNRSSLFKDFIG